MCNCNMEENVPLCKLLFISNGQAGRKYTHEAHEQLTVSGENVRRERERGREAASSLSLSLCACSASCSPHSHIKVMLCSVSAALSLLLLLFPTSLS